MAALAPTHTNRHLLVALMALLALAHSQLLLNSISTNNSTILAPATYTLNFLRYSISPVPLNSYLLLTFSPDYLGSINANPTCASNSFGPAPLTCSYSGTTLYITQIFTNSSYLALTAFTITVSNITNPSPAGDYTPVTTLQIVAANSSVVDSSSSSVVLTISEGAAVCGASLLNAYVYQSGQISVTYTSKYITTASTGYSLALQVPTSYPDDATSNSIGLTLSVPFTTVSSSGTYIFQMDFVNSFTMSLLMPPSTKPQTNFISLYSYNSQGVVDSCDLSISQVQPNTFTSLTISQGVVQTVASVKFDMTLSTPLAPTDYLIINFDKTFDLSAVGSTVAISGFGTFTLAKYNNSILQVTSISQQPVLNARLIFTIAGIKMPFTTSPADIDISLQTSEKIYYRIVENYPYSAASGSITASVSCLSVQVGTTGTSCVFTVKTSSVLTSNAYLNIVLPSSFPLTAGSSQCALSGSGLTSTPTCIFYPANNTIQVPNINSTLANITNTTFTLTLPLSMPQGVGSYSLTFSSGIQGSVVDMGLVGLTTTSRRLKTSQFSVVSSSTITSSSTVYTLYFSLPFSHGVTYTVFLSFPFDIQGNLSILLNGAGATLVSFSSQVLVFTSNQLLNNASVAVSNLLTPATLQPIPTSVNITHLNTTYFYGSTVITMAQPRTFTYASLLTSNQVAYSPAIATFSLSDLVSNNKVVISASYPYFYSSSSQPNCSSIITCGVSGSLTVLTANTSGVTTFSVNIRNLGYVGQTQINITEYDSMQIYARQSSLLTLTVTTPNVITVIANQTNPYLAESSTYTFNLTLSTPNASSLLLTPPSGLIVASASCQLNCGSPSKLAIGYLFSLTSTSSIVTLTVTNPTAFDSTNTFIFKTANSLGDMDFGQFTPQLVCNSPCRSCSTNTSVCLTCYSWSSQTILDNRTCIGTCPVGLFSATNSAGILTCSTCGSYCSVCSGAANNCTTCLNGSFYYNFGCYPACPLGTFTVTYYCSDCLQPNCSICNATTCTKCFSSYSFFNGSCLSVCLDRYYSLGGECVACASTCLTCSPYNGTCLNCSSPYLLYGGSCFSSCPSGVFQRINAGYCQACQPPCSACSIYSTNCTSCLRTYNSNNYFYFSGQCYANKCLDGYYGDTTTSLCVLCPTGCTNCTSSACLTCSSPLYLYQGVCFSECPRGTYGNSTTCLKCISICSACVSIDTCTACIGGYNLYNSSCLLNCPTLFYANLTGSICLACSPPCVQCTFQGCTTCLSGYYLQQYTCVTSCTGAFHPNNATLVCQNCINPCAGCTWSNICTSCITSYSLFGTSCFATCPASYYSNGALCLSCPSLCPTCTYRNNKPACTSCGASTFLYSFNCTSVCPANTTASGQTCYSSDCSALAHCISCSGQQCLECSSLYQMDSSYSCSQFVSGSAVSAALLKIPVPFPFLIATIMVLIIAFLLKHNFTKMFSPLFVYPIAGCLEFLCLCLWTLLSVFWNIGLQAPLPYASVVYAPVLIASAYFIFNVLQFVLWYKRVRTDRQYKLWQKQDNLCASLTIAILSLFFSFRLDSLKFSRTGHNPHLSARLTSPQSFKHYSVLAVLSLFLNSAIILVSVYISYLQTSMNYLFFTGIQIAVISIIMIIFSIAMLCVSRQQLLEDKNQYQIGYDQDNLEGKSVEQLLEVVEEHHQHGHYDDTGNAVLLKNDYSQSGSQDLTLIEPAQHLQFQDKVNSQVNDGKSVAGSDEIFGYTPQQRDSSNHILIDEIERDKQEALQLATHYKLAEQPQPSTFPRQTGAIVKQRLPELHEDSSDIESMQSFEQFRIDYSKGKWQKEEKNGLVGQQQGIQGEFIEEFHIKQLIQEKIKKEEQEKKKEQEQQRKFIELQKMEEQRLQKLEEEKLRQANLERQLMLERLRQQQLKKQNERKRLQEQQRKRKEEQQRVKQQRLKKIQEQKKREQRWKLMKQEAKRKKQEEERLLKEKLERMRQEQLELQRRLKEEEMKERLRIQQERKLQLEISKRELQKIEKLKSELQKLQGLTQEFQSRNHQLQLEESQLHFVEKQKERESKERALMGVEDRLSRMAKVFEEMWKKAAEIKQRPTRANKIKREEQKQIRASQAIKYHNDDANNLVPELSPRKIKVNPKPLPEQYTRKHLFVEQGTEILQSSGDEQLFDQQLQIVFEGGQPKITEDKAVDKPKSHIHRNKSASKTKISHLVYEDKQKKDVQQLTIQQKLPELPYQLQKLRSNPHKAMPREDSQAQINMVFEDNAIQYLQSQEKQQSIWSRPNDLQQDIRSPIRPQSRQSDIMSLDTHWPIQPEMQERILEIERKADKYLNQPKRKDNSHKKFILQDPSNEIYEEQEEGETQMGEIVFEESDQIDQEQTKTAVGSGRKRYPIGRVNRRVIDLSPSQ